MEKTKHDFLTIDEYIDSFPEPVQKMLKKIRGIVKETAPDAEEKISYKMPAFFLNKNLIYFAGYTKHVGLYPGVNAINAFRDKLAKYKFAKGSIQFPLDEPLPVELIKKIVEFRIEEISKKRQK